jgi:RNase adaptor protein for sRNA GlmZ degradation
MHTFGYRRGAYRHIRTSNRVPVEMNAVIDTRFLPCVSHDPGLKALDGHSPEVKRELDRHGEFSTLIRVKTQELGRDIRNWCAHGRQTINIGIGSGWGRHRAVAVADLLAWHLQRELGDLNLPVRVYHKNWHLKERPKPLVSVTPLLQVPVEADERSVRLAVGQS